MVNSLQMNRWIRAIALAKLLFEDEGYFATYLDEIEHFIREKGSESDEHSPAEKKNDSN